MSMHQFNYTFLQLTVHAHIEITSVWGVLCVAYAHSDMNKNGTLQVSTMNI